MDRITEKHLDALIRFNKKQYEKLGAPFEETQSNSVISDAMELLSAVGNPMAALEWLVKKGNEAGLPDKYKGRESYGGDK